MKAIYLLPLLLIVMLGGCDLFDDDDNDNDKDRKNPVPVEMSNSFSSFFDEAFTRDENGDPVVVNDRELDDDATDSTFDTYLN